MRFDFDVRGLDDTLLRIKGLAGEKDSVRNLLDEAAERAFRHMRLHVPIGETAELEASLRRGPVEWHPGGAGGGGYYEVEVGPENPPEHLDFVFGGTSDVFKRRMKIQKQGEPAHWVMKRRGQQPQTEWVTDAQDIAREWIRMGITRLDLFG